MRSVMQEAEGAGVLDLKLFGHTVARAAGAGHTDREDMYTVKPDSDDMEGVTWAFKPKDLQSSQLVCSNAANFWQCSTLTSSCRLERVWRMGMDDGQVLLVPKKPVYIFKGNTQLTLMKGMGVRVL